MKKLILAAALLLALDQVKAQNTTTPGGRDVQTPRSVSDQFRNDYPNSQATWTQDGEYFRADYRDGSSSRAIIYDRNGNMISRDEISTNGNYPTAINDYYTKNYPNEKQGDVWTSTDANGNKTYYTRRNSQTLWFDKSGTYNKSGRSKMDKTKIDKTNMK